LDLALDEAERLKHLLSEILTYAREPSLDTQPVELIAFSQALYDVLAELPVVQGRSLQFHPALPAAWIEGDADKLKQVLINLVRNACEAVPAGGIVTWQITPAAYLRQVCIRIHNGGEPIPPDILAKLGQPFFTTKARGNGLGLAIVKRIVEAHRGRFSITSTAETGTTVQVLLPLTSPP
jgi:signal transduction histidine kinase